MSSRLSTLSKRVKDVLYTFFSSYSIPLLAFLIIIAILSLLGWRYSAWRAAATTLAIKDQIAIENDALKTIAQVAGGSFFLVTAYFTWRSARTAEKNLAISQEGQITDRFNKAVVNLGESDSLAKRLGGIYALERIARDSPKDHWTIMEVLTAYARESAPRREDQDIHAQDQDGRQHRKEKKPAADIEAILTVIRRRAWQHEKREEGEHILDLGGVDAPGVMLGGANLEGADFEGANLERTNLIDANLKKTYLMGTNLRGTHLTGAHLEEAYLKGAHLEEAYLDGAHLEGAYFGGAHLEGAYLRGVHLEGAYLSGAHLEGADLTDARGLTPAQLKRAIIDQTTKLPPSIQIALNIAEE